MNVSNLPADGGGFVFASGWGAADLRAVFSGGSLILSPNTIGDPATFWYIGGGGPGAPGNKIMEANMYVEVNGATGVVGALSGHNVTFSGTVTSNTLTAAHNAVVFIKDFAPDYSSSNTITAPLVNGAFSVTLATDPGEGRHVQYGFQMTGENVWVTDVEPFGSVVISAQAIVPGDPNVDVDPDAGWQGYMNVYNLPDPDDDGAFQPDVSGVRPTADLRASFNNDVLTLSPYTIEPFPDGADDSYWYLEERRGNKNMEANMYVQVPDGTLSGQTVNFTGTVLSNTLTGAHAAVAFIKEFTPDYSSFTESSVALAPGAFSVSLEISGNTSNHVQYGFQMLGPNVWPDDAAGFGSVQVTSAAITGFTEWIAAFDFSGFTNPDLSKSGDPDGDGKNNLQEFALNGNPASAAASGKVRSAVETSGAEGALVLTLPVRGNPAFAGSPALSAVAGEVRYRIEGTNDFGVFDQEVIEVTPASAGGMPVLDAGWSYRSFRLGGAIGGATPRGPKGFLRVVTEPAP